MITTEYENCVEELTSRILYLISNNLGILTMDDPWTLFDVPRFQCKDLGPSFLQASIALSDAKRIWVIEQSV